MARPDKREIQQRRTREVVDKALSRGRFGDAADALLTLPAESRAWALESVARGLTLEISRTSRASEPAPLLAWLARIEREPRLLPPGDDAMRVRWALFVAALRAQQWSRVRALFEALRPALAGSPWWGPLEALALGEGKPSPEAFPETVDADSARLGYDDALPRASYSAPAQAELAEGACIACFAAEPWSRFRDVVMGWLARSMAPEVALAVRRCAVLLSQRELVRRAREPRAALEVARFCAGQIAEAGAPPDLEQVARTCLKVLAQALVGEVRERGPVEAAATIASAALRYPALVPLVEAVVLEPMYGEQALDPASRMLRALLSQRTSVELVAKAAEVLFAQEGEHINPQQELEAPPWLIAAFERVLAQPAELVAALSDHKPARAAQLTIALLDNMPIPLGVRTVEELWDLCREERARELLAKVAETLVRRMRLSSSPPDVGDDLAMLQIVLQTNLSHPLRHASEAELRRFLRSPEARSLRETLGAMRAAITPLPPAMVALWTRLSERVVAYRPLLLEAALELASTKAARQALVARFLERRPSLLGRLESLRQATIEGCAQSADMLEPQLTRGLIPVQIDAARALLVAEESGAPRRIRNAIARFLHEAIERDGQIDQSAEVLDGLRRAKRYLRKKKAASKPKQKPATKKAAPKKPAQPRETATPTPIATAKPQRARKRKTLSDDETASTTIEPSRAHDS